jgi:hypothetical protein
MPLNRAVGWIFPDCVGECGGGLQPGLSEQAAAYRCQLRRRTRMSMLVKDTNIRAD